MVDIEIIDKAPTNKGTCYACRKKILKGTPRIWFRDKFRKEINKIKDMSVKRLICHRCVEDVLWTEIYKHKSELKLYVGFQRKFKRMMKGKTIKGLILKEKMMESLENEEDMKANSE